jgi:glycosyltransferase involved in cell wall biosynthesis
MPKVSIILPVYNGEPYLRQAVQSILDQTFADYECIIINDGSTDNSLKTLASFQDPRLHIVSQTNQGLRAALNAGIALAKGEYIARMDQDDISRPNRFTKQIDFFNTHPEHILVGTTFAYINNDNQITGAFPALLDDVDIKRELYTKTPFGHGTIMVRSSALKQGSFKYRQEAVHVEDYDLWIRLASVGKYANLPEILYLWRHTPENTTSKYADIQRHNAASLTVNALKKQGMTKLVGWPGWHNFRKYHNSSQEVGNKRVEVRRHDAHCSLYLALAWLLFQKKRYVASCMSFSYALCISPTYVLHTFIRRIVRSI